MEAKIVFGIDNITEMYNLETNSEMNERLKVSESPFAFFVDEYILLYGDADDNGKFFTIRDIWSTEKRKCYGKTFIRYLFEQTSINEIEGDSTPEAVPFWTKMGANFKKDVFDDFMEDEDFEDLIPFRIYSNHS